MELSEHKVGAVVVVKPNGPLVSSGAEGLRNRVRSLAAEAMGRVVIDMESVSFVDSKGIEALLDSSDILASSGMALRVCGTTDTVYEALRLTGSADAFDFHIDANSAARSFL
jgi:anti-sigma B factor antagonist